MKAVITGDIIHSRQSSPEEWQVPLKKIFTRLGKTPKAWEIYRGDSFQLETEPEEAMGICLLIKAAMKSVKQLDVRMAVGLGEISYRGASITESNGEAFINSGSTFELLKPGKQNLLIKSPDEDFNKEINLMLLLILAIADDWSTTSAETIKMVLENPELSQSQIAEKLGIGQSSVSERFSRARITELQEFIAYFENRVKTKFSKS